MLESDLERVLEGKDQQPLDLMQILHDRVVGVADSLGSTMVTLEPRTSGGN